MAHVQNNNESLFPPFYPDNQWHRAAEKDLRFHQAHQLRARVLEHELHKLCGKDFPGKEHIEAHLRQKYRLNRSARTLRSTLSSVEPFLVFLKSNGKPHLDEITRGDLEAFIEHEQERGLKSSTVNTRLKMIKAFVRSVMEQGVVQPDVLSRRLSIKVAEGLPRAIVAEDLRRLLNAVEDVRDRAMFMLMLRCGLRVEEVSGLVLGDIDLRRARIIIQKGKGSKGRVVYLSNDAHQALVAYLKARPASRVRNLFLVEKGTMRAQAISVRGIQKRMESYALRAGLKVSCHDLRHTMATQLLNADAELVTIQDLLGHSRITTTQRYCRLSNLKVQRDYYKAMEMVMKKQGAGHPPHQVSNPGEPGMELRR